MTKRLKACILSALLVSGLFASADQKDKILISAKEAIKLIGKPGVMFVSGDSEDVYKLGHIKGSTVMYAHHLHHSDITGHMECAPLFMCPEHAEKFIGEHGIDNNTLVIAYDDFKGPNATGVYVFFKSFGHDKVKILNGGRAAIMALDPEQKIYDELKKKYRALKKAKAPKEEIKKAKEAMKKQAKKLLVIKGEEHIAPKKYHIDPKKIDYSIIAGKDEVYKAVKDILKNGKNSKYAIIDTRSMIEIIGQRKMDNVARGGHIPGAKFIEWKKITDFEHKLSFPENLEKLKKMFKEQGITPDKTIYAYCQVGTGRGSDIITALKLLGYKNAKVYTGSWDEWGNDMNLPIRR